MMLSRMGRQRFKDKSTRDFGDQTFYAILKSTQTLGKAKKRSCPAEHGGSYEKPP
jgi:hypothetical protein